MPSKVILLLITILLIFTGISSAIGCSSESDVQKVKEIIINEYSAINNKDFGQIYELYSPNYRQTISYEDFIVVYENMLNSIAATYGTDQFDLNEKSIEVSIEGDWAYGTYDVWLGETALDMSDVKPADILRRVNGKWYQVADTPEDPGYNVMDIPSVSQ